MSGLVIEMMDGVTHFRPGDLIQGDVVWTLGRVPDELKLHLLFYTEGKGDRDAQVVETVELPVGGISGRAPFTFAAPAGPYSFSGKLISLIWALEFVTEKKGEVMRQPIIIAPQATEIILAPADD